MTLLQHAIDDIAAGFYRQAMFADFELRAHRVVEGDGPITAEVLQEIYLDVLNGFFGSALDDKDWYRNTWARIPHFFQSPFYVFQYATSKAAAVMFHRRMTEGEEGKRSAVVDAYLELLRSGGDDHPISQLKKAGVDFSTTKPTEALVAEMDHLIDRLEKEASILSN
ncbi:MAG: M3 family metallopeptidase [Acidobacteriota bacterium]